VIVMEAISREFRVALPWELLYADDLAVIAETEEENVSSGTGLLGCPGSKAVKRSLLLLLLFSFSMKFFYHFFCSTLC